MKRILLAALLGMACTASHAAAHAGHAGQSELSNASAKPSGVVVGGSIPTLAATGSVVVTGMKPVGDALEVVLESAADASRATLRLSGRAAAGVSIAAGTGLEVVSAPTGYVLVMAGQAIAFLPNEAGKAMLHHSRAIRWTAAHEVVPSMDLAQRTVPALDASGAQVAQASRAGQDLSRYRMMTID